MLCLAHSCGADVANEAVLTTCACFVLRCQSGSKNKITVTGMSFPLHESGQGLRREEHCGHFMNRLITYCKSYSKSESGIVDVE
jgi:hypothetical protein